MPRMETVAYNEKKNFLLPPEIGLHFMSLGEINKEKITCVKIIL